MLNIPTVSWRTLPGYQFVKNPDSAMLSESGYIHPRKVRANQHEKPRYENIEYDREYLLEWLVKRFISPLSHVGKEKIDEVVNEAWARYCKQLIEPYHANKN